MKQCLPAKPWFKLQRGDELYLTLTLRTAFRLFSTEKNCLCDDGNCSCLLCQTITFAVGSFCHYRYTRLLKENNAGLKGCTRPV